MELPKELEEMVFEDPAIDWKTMPSELDEDSQEIGLQDKWRKIEGLYLKFGKNGDNGKKIIDIFSKYPDIREVAIGAGRVLAVSEKPERFSDDYLKGLEDGAKAFVYCFSGNELIGEGEHNEIVRMTLQQH